MFFISFLFAMGLILFLVNRKKNIGLSLFIGGTLLLIANRVSLTQTKNIFFNTFFAPESISLALTIATISILGALLNTYGLMEKMTSALEGTLRNTKATILLAPALIGTLLVTGGALMSCPVVDGLGNRLSLSNDKKAAINLVFRHALYFIFPLAPTLILASQIGELKLGDLIWIQAPIAITLYLLGYIFYLRKAKYNPRKKSSLSFAKSFLRLAFYALPIWISFVGTLCLHWPFFVSLLMGILTIPFIFVFTEKKKLAPLTFAKDFIKSLNINMVLAIWGILFFKNVIGNFDNLYTLIRHLLDQGFPIEALMFISSALICFPLASTQPGIALLFPILLPLAPDPHTRLRYAMFIYTSSFFFYYISPLHMCQVLTLSYFDTELKDLYKNYLILLPLAYGSMLFMYFVFS